MRTATANRPNAEAIREAVYRAIDKAGADGLSLGWMNSVVMPGGLKVHLSAEDRNATLDRLVAEGKIVAGKYEPGGGCPPTTYRSTVAVAREEAFWAEAKRRGLPTTAIEREAAFQAEARLRGYVRVRSIPLLGKVS